MGSKIPENRYQNLYKIELESKVTFNFPLGLIFATISPDFGVQFLFVFLFSGPAVCPKLGYRDKVAIGKPLGLVFVSFLIGFLVSWNVLCAFRDGQGDSWRHCHKEIVGEIATRASVGIWVVGVNS